MSSFTSSFRREAPVVCVVALALAACELGVRASVHRASIDVRHIKEIPRIVDGLSKARRPTVLFLGNSLTRAGVVPTALSLDRAHVAMIYPDDTTIADWHYLYERYVRSKGAAPDVLLVGFAGDHLSDSPALHLERLGGEFGGLGALAEAFRHDVLDLDGRVSYLLASLSTAYANRERVRALIFAALIPHYKSSAQAFNRAVRARHEASHGPSPRRYSRLARFLELFKGGSTKLVFVAIPVPAPHPIDPSLEELVRESGSRLLDLRRPAGLTEADYLDGYHLTPRGGELFSRELSRRLLDIGELRNLLAR